jgi:lipid-A-disaccharide synthase-like uncharacterized protein
MKRGPLVAMLAVTVLGAAVVVWPHLHDHSPDLMLGIGPNKYRADVIADAPTGTRGFQFRDWPETGSQVVRPSALGAGILTEIDHTNARPRLFQILHINNWKSLLWVTLGLVGQGCFFGRMAVQWIASERRRESVVPALFWWLSLVGSLMLFAYFAWRSEFIGLLGQGPGVVIYARNLHLIRRHRQRQSEPVPPPPQDDPVPEP